MRSLAHSLAGVWGAQGSCQALWSRLAPALASFTPWGSRDPKNLINKAGSFYEHSSICVMQYTTIFVVFYIHLGMGLHLGALAPGLGTPIC